MLLSIHSFSLSLPLTKLMNTGSERLKLEIFKVYSPFLFLHSFTLLFSSLFFVTESVLTTIHAKKEFLCFSFLWFAYRFPSPFWVYPLNEDQRLDSLLLHSFSLFSPQKVWESNWLTLLFPYFTFLSRLLSWKSESNLKIVYWENEEKKNLEGTQRRRKDKKDYGRDKCFLRQEKCCGPFYPGLDLLLFGWEFFLLVILLVIFLVFFSSQEPCVSVERLDLRSLSVLSISLLESLYHHWNILFLFSSKLKTWLSSLFPSIDEETGLTLGEEAVSCQERQNNCTELVQPYLREVQYMFPTTARDVNEMCKVWSQFVDCVRRYVSSCFSDERRTKFNQAVENSVDTVHAICSSDTVQRGQFVWSIHKHVVLRRH